MNELERIRMELLEMEIERLTAALLRVGALPAHWRTCALTADSGDERETWVLCADQLAAALAPPPGVDPPAEVIVISTAREVRGGDMPPGGRSR